MERIDWLARAVESEVAYSVARGGVATDHGDFIHVHNPHVPWAGDYNRTLGVRASSVEDFGAIVRRVERIHEKTAVHEPNSYDTHPSIDGDGEWIDRLGEIGCRAWTEVFFKRDVAVADLPDGFEWREVSEEDYLPWRQSIQEQEGWFDAEGWATGLPLERQFVRVYRPYWLLENGQLVAWVHIANLGSYFRHFDVEVAPELRGRGYGKLLMRAVEAEAARQGIPHLLIRCAERLCGFYEACGLVECGRGSIIRPCEGV